MSNKTIRFPVYPRAVKCWRGREALLESPKQASLAAIGAPASADDLSAALSIADNGRRWIGGSLTIQGASESELIDTLNSTGSWAAVLRSTGTMSHMVVVDGSDVVGNLMIRDPWEGTSYTMKTDDFINYWTSEAVFRA